MTPVVPALTGEQAAAAHAGPEGAFLVAAGPGTGKTFTMVERFRWLVTERRVPADRILAVTFTEAAAAELRERAGRELPGGGGHRAASGARGKGDLLQDAWIGTFHSVCARLIREHAYLVGVPREVRVLDELGQRLLVERLQARLRSGAEPGLDRDFEALSPDELSDLLRGGPAFALKLKGRGLLPDQFRDAAMDVHRRVLAASGEGARLALSAEREAVEVLHLVYATYQRWLGEAGLMDFDDLILTTIRALEGVPEFRARCRERFRQILVDEFQDTNRIQLQLIERMAAPGFANVTVVGDAKQSIYGWRDAEIDNIRTRFPGRRLPLTLNRRSVQEILDCATAFIRRDPGFADEPALVAGRGVWGGPAVAVLMASAPRAEAELVAGEIGRLRAAGRPYRDIALLSYSVRQLPRDFEDVLRERGIPFVTAAGSGFFDREEIKDVVALLRLVAEPMDDGALVRALQGPVVRLDDAALYPIAIRRSGRRGRRLRDCLEEARAEGWPGLEPASARRIEALLAVTDRLAEAADRRTLADLLGRLLEGTGYLRHVRLAGRRAGRRAERNVGRVFQMAERFERDVGAGGPGAFVTYLRRVMETGMPVGEAAPEEPEDAVHLLTVHGAKGREFPVVFLVNVRRPNPRDTEKLFFDPDFGFVMKWWRNEQHPRFKEHAPGAGSLALARQERRRAVYVAITRARDLLFVSASRPDQEAATLEVEEDDHFAEVLTWALAHPEAARIVRAEQLELPGATSASAPPSPAAVDVAGVIDRLERLQTAAARPAASRRDRTGAPGGAPSSLSFSQLHSFEVCPVRYRFQLVWRVPAPPDELLPAPARAGAAGAELGEAVHQALAAWHRRGGDLERLYAGPEAGREMLRGYLAHPLASAPTRGAEVEFNLRLGDAARVRGVVDRICELDGRITLVDYKTNARLDARLRHAYAAQLRLYGLAAERGLLPPARSPRLLLFDLRRSEAIEVEPSPAAAEAWALDIGARIQAADFRLGPEHADRPCALCAYRPLCPERR